MRHNSCSGILEMTSKWLHIAAPPSDPWLLPIRKAVNIAADVGRTKALGPDIDELGLHITTRLNMIPLIVNRINSEVSQIYRVARNYADEDISTESRRGHAVRIDKDLLHSSLADIDAILFELNSLCELMARLFEKLYAHVGRPIRKGRAGLAIKSVIEAAGHDARWFQELDGHRNFFIHEGAPYLAIDISIEDTPYDLLIMKENIKSFEDESKFVRLSEINDIVNGFASAKPAIQQHLAGLFR